MARAVVRPTSERTIRVLSTVVVVALITTALYWARAILIPLALAVLITFVLTPLIVTLQRRGLGRIPSVVVVLALALILIVGLGAIVGEQMVQLTKTLPDHADQIRSKVAATKKMFSPNDGGRLSALVNDLSEMLDPAQAPTAAEGAPAVVVNTQSTWLARIQTYLSPAAEVLGQAALTLILVIFMLLRREDLRNRMIQLLGQGRVTTTTKAVDETSHRISRFLLAQFLLNSGFGLLIATALAIMGVPFALLWGFLAFLMRYVPYIGTWIGVLPPAIFTFAISDGWSLTIGVFVLYVGLELAVANLVEPLLYGPRLGLSEVAQLVATAFWAFLWGPVGIILAWPLTTCVLMLGKYVPQWRFLSVLLGDQPALSPRVALYQRLAAHDVDEAAEIVEQELGNRPLHEVLDDLLIPALAQAREDVSIGLLSEDDLNFVVHAVDEVTEQISESKPEQNSDKLDSRVRTLVVPAKDAVDHAGALLLTRMVEPTLWDIHLAVIDTLTSELLGQIENSKPDLIVIVSVAQGGMTHTRYLCKRIRQRYPQLKVIVARLAGAHDENNRSIQLLRDAGAEQVTFTLDETRTVLTGWRAVYATNTVRPATGNRPTHKDATRSPIGTPPA